MLVMINKATSESWKRLKKLMTKIEKEKAPKSNVRNENDIHY